MLERRQYERFDLTLPASVEIMNSEEKETFNFLSADISAGGVYMYPNRSIPNGSQIKLNLKVTNERLKKLEDAQSLIIRAEGTVVRTTPRGMAVCFGEDCQILSLSKWERRSVEHVGRKRMWNPSGAGRATLSPSRPPAETGSSIP